MGRFCRGLGCWVILPWFAVGSVQAATIGFTEEFDDDLGGFGGGSQAYIRATTGGVGGTDDGFLVFANTDFAFQLGTRTAAATFTGDLSQDGVTGFSFWLNDVGSDDALEIHVGVGTCAYRKRDRGGSHADTRRELGLRIVKFTFAGGLPILCSSARSSSRSR